MVIVGGGLAGVTAAQALRAEGWQGSITLLSNETLPPYDRPPLSKDVLRGERTIESCTLCPPERLHEQGIEIRLGTTVTGIDRKHRSVMLRDGKAIGYQNLLIATGASPRRLPAHEKPGAKVHVLRSAEDATALAADLRPGRRILIVGGGFIGLEVAASAVQNGCKVTVVETAARLVARAVPATIGTALEAAHRSAGVDFRFGSSIASTETKSDALAVTLDDATAIACDALLICIGIQPNTQLAADAGLRLDNGIAVDETLRTSDPNIFAIGDVCSFPHPTFDRRLRLESWNAAEEQGRLVAKNMLGGREAYAAVPWLWSDQYDFSVQVTGLPLAGSHEIMRKLGPDAFILFHLDDDGRLVGASAIGPSELIGGNIRAAQMMIARGVYPDPPALADSYVSLKSLLPRAVARTAGSSGALLRSISAASGN